MASHKEYWVVGGEFTSMNFHQIKPDTKEVYGPFKTRADAEAKWKSLTEGTRHLARTAFRILEESRED